VGNARDFAGRNFYGRGWGLRQPRIKRDEINMDWKPIDTAPFGPDVELAIIDRDGTHALAFPCQRFVGGWMNAKTRKELSVLPTHWRIWTP
jgi:hypothetical protein